ncbi:glycoside hydrolase family 127 protein [Parvularcula sp. LCG005]|uniref:glycoside hydrolase family 127 protein n=1 Tax=Parvularcula sp. LCG005 TaxID=3078805 RepID=UPI002943B299|nr:glycoside hydrolase family 127 protein [Parvularcula sp. LCG005]WOI54784.1 glycoside hydrolase family 127 protein [Parvularcula sp. LCG005]
MGQVSQGQFAINRRLFLVSVSAAALTGPALARVSGTTQPTSVPLADIRLKPSVFRTSVDTNRKVLFDLEPDRLLHNFRWSAGLEPKAPVYGGWEKRGIAGHSLGHYLTALSIMAQRGDEGARERARYIVSELQACQDAHDDGYVGGTTVDRDGQIVDGKIVFEELRNGQISTSGFDINGGWVPLYTWHKVQAGLIDAYRQADIPDALPVLVGMSTYLGDVLDTLDHDQMQKVLAAEHGGLNESYAELYAITGNVRWLKLAERIRHEAVLNPLAEGKDNLPGLHANTQIPKVIGLARLHELTANASYASTSEFFYRTVTDHHSYVIGGNSEREHFSSPDVVAPTLSDRTCEACNSYNMLKLTRHLWAWQPDAAYFDEYERTYINHILAHQHPDTGMYVYFMPLRSGSRRTYSTLEDSFWCCMGSGMESHAKHGDSAFWQSGGDTLFVNLYMAADVDWRAGEISLSIDTIFPEEEHIRIKINSAGNKTRTLALRLPGWSAAPSITVNGKQVKAEPGPGYATIERKWKAGDEVAIHLPMHLTVESAPDDEALVTFRHGPLVLAANLGTDEEREGVIPPALVTADVKNAATPVSDQYAAYHIADAVPAPLTLEPFYDQYDNRTAVYFPRFTQAAWAEKEQSYRDDQAALQALKKRTLDVIYLGEMQPERDHNFSTNQSDVIANGGRTGRTAWWGEGNFIAFDLAVSEGPVILRAMYWGEETGKDFQVMVEGEVIARERRKMPPSRSFVYVDYDVPERLTRGKKTIKVQFQTLSTDAPVYEVRTLKPETI